METSLQDLSGGLARAVERCAPSVVRVEGRRYPSSGVVWAEDGVVVTTDHSLEWDEGIRIGLDDGRTVPAALVGRDPGTDVAVLRAEATGLAATTWVDPEDLKVGQLVLSVSRPNAGVRAGLGIVAVLGGPWRTPAGGRLDRYVQTDVTPHPSFSGSLLVDAAGAGAGLNNVGLVRRATLAVPGITVRRAVEELLAHGRVRRGYLGVALQPVRLPPGHDPATGLLVLNVEPGSPAATAGLVLGDVLLALDGQPLRQPGDLLTLLDADRIGTEARLRLLRAGEAQEVAVTIGASGKG